MTRPRKSVILAGAAAGAVAVLRHGGRHATQGHRMPGRHPRWRCRRLRRHEPAPARLARRAHRRRDRGGRPAGAQVLEVSCGPGHLSLRLARHGFEVTGLDLDSAMIAHAEANADRLGNVDQRWRSFLVGDVAALAFPDESCDLVVSTLSIHHWADPTASLAKIGRVLRPGARALIWDFRTGVRPHLFGPRHAHLPDPLDHTRGAPLRVVNATPWPWRFTPT
jgi:SAM-dependent methyltransferase